MRIAFVYLYCISVFFAAGAMAQPGSTIELNKPQKYEKPYTCFRKNAGKKYKKAAEDFIKTPLHITTIISMATTASMILLSAPSWAFAMTIQAYCLFIIIHSMLRLQTATWIQLFINAMPEYCFTICETIG